MDLLDGQHFDVGILGTGLGESILAAALAQAGKTVVHLDEADDYGGFWRAPGYSDLLNWAGALQPDEEVDGTESSGISLKDGDVDIDHPQRLRSRYCNVSVNHPSAGTSAESNLAHHANEFQFRKNSRQYNLSLAPSLSFAAGPLVEVLRQSNVGQHLGFRLVEDLAIWSTGAGDSPGFRQVPLSKEAIFKAPNESLALIEKRRIMKFLQWVMGHAWEGEQEVQRNRERSLLTLLSEDFQISSSDSLTQALQYILGLQNAEIDPAIDAMNNISLHLRSAGRFGGTSALLNGQFGGPSEIVQGFCRSCAVYGGVYCLGRRILRLQYGKDHPYPWQIVLAKGDDPSRKGTETIRVRHLIGSTLYLEHLIVHPSTTRVTDRAILVLPTSIAIHPFVSTSSKPIEGSGPGDKDTAEPKLGPDALFLVIPPDTFGQHGTIWATQSGDQSLACPPGQFILQLACSRHKAAPVNDFSSLIQALGLDPLFSLTFSFLQRTQGRVAVETLQPDLTIVPDPGPCLALAADDIAQWAREAFDSIARDLCAPRGDLNPKSDADQCQNKPTLWFERKNTDGGDDENEDEA